MIIRPLTSTSTLTIQGHPVGLFCDEPTPPAPPIPSDMDFIYLAKDFDGTKIPNKAVNSTFGDYIQYGTLTVNGSGSSCYLSNGGSDSNYLQNSLSSDNALKIQGVNNTYTFFIRMMQDTSTAMGGIMSTRSNGGYIYMLRCENKQLQIHTSSGYNLGSDFSLAVDRVYKVVIDGASFYAKNLDTNAEYNLTYSTNRSMGTNMRTFDAFSNYNEAHLDRFYAFAGIPRVTTAEEDAVIKDVLMNQSL
jgi:hypothetical protein